MFVRGFDKGYVFGIRVAGKEGQPNEERGWKWERLLLDSAVTLFFDAP
jgi:hypothetical protein